MQRPGDRPIGVTAIAVAVAIKGLASLAMATDLVAFDLARSTRTDEPVAGVAVVIGLALLWKAYGLWRLHHRAWLVMLLLVAIDGATAALELLFGTATVTVWISLALAAGIGLYLLQPSVRRLFSGEHAGS